MPRGRGGRVLGPPEAGRGPLTGASPLTPEEVARYPLPGTNAPVSAAFSPDGRWVAYLWSPDHSLRRGLFVLDAETGAVREPMDPGAGALDEASLSLEERLQRERQRELGEGVTSLAWARDAARLLVPRRGGLAVLDPPGFEPRPAVPAGDRPLLDPCLSPDGAHVAFVLDGEVHVAAVDGSSPPRPVTSGARERGVTNGLAEFVAAEEMDRDRGFWWSPDGARLAFVEVDESHIPVYRIVHQGSDQVGPGAQEDHHYPFAGAENARVRLGVVPAGGGAEPVWADLGEGWEYLARVDWLAPDVLVAQVENRAQTRLDVLAVDPATGASRVLLTEEGDPWVNLHSLLRPLGGGRFLWASERTGFRHLEVRGAGGALERVLTEGDWFVEAVAAVSDDRVWFTASRESPLERHLYEVPLAGGEPRRLTAEAGVHTAAVDPRGGRFVDTWSSAATPPRAVLRRLADGVEEAPLLPAGATADPRLEALAAAGALPSPERLTVAAEDGTVLHVMVYRPGGEPPFPTVVSVYGGPHAQRVIDAWTATASMRNQYLRSLGFLVVVADNRGSAGRGLAFEAPIHRRPGTVEVDDQVRVVRTLAEQGLVDPERVGIYGWSYGGYMSALCLARAGDVFRAGVAGAPVTAWDGYDTHYTERYLGLPADNPDGYRQAAVMTHLAGLRDGALMLVHGLIDENVHFRHTARLVNALIRARVRYDLLLFPDERHVPRAEADRVYMEERIRDFLVERLAPPPAEAELG